ncbi:protein Shroom [Homalodisca vitripennis]|uniref:protein Shroom n=1 Tax=Homalodisca vitripennis TaxID=197043 RepID=UPI001EEA9117|nr:protein Shroom [Homalodisca vitripennis]XP_046677589.1 protein Shroom [Homalodisca vitripennis]XP_046677590.1 protein Shroom [Homalodisca vitripennis]XP_046677591.1 protein Shroom [Homalodisca vitripennis]
MVPKTIQDAAMREPGPAPPPPVKSHSSSILSSLLHSAHPQGGSGGLRSSPPPAPVRDASSLKAVRYGPGHEKFPSWPAAVPSRPQAGGSCRSKSWTEQTHYPKEEPPVISRPFNKRINPSFSQQLRTVMERCEKIGPETYLPRPDCDGTREYNVPSPPERDVGLTQADLEEYTRSYQDPTYTQLESQLTQEELEQYSRAYDEASLRTVHQTQASYAQSEGYHSYVSSTDSTTTTPFLDRLRRESEAARVEGHESSSSGSSSETLKWHGSMSDVSSTGTTPLIAHSAKVQTPQRHHSESVLYLSQLVRHNQINNQRKLFPVSTYTVQPCEQHSPRSPPAMSVAERICELERQQAAPQQPRPPYPPSYDPSHRHPHPHSHPSQDPSRVTDHASLKAIQKKALLSFYERHHSAWKSEPQLSPPQPPPRPKPPPTTSSNAASRRSSSASDYGRREQKLSQQVSKEAPTPGENENLPVRHQHSSSCGSLSAAVSGPFIMGPAISIDDWVPARPPKKPHLRAAYPVPRMSSPDLPPPSPPPVVEDEVIVSDEPLPPPPPEDQLPLISPYSRSQDPKFQYLNKSYLGSSNINSSISPESPKSYVSDRSKPEPQYENQPELRRCSKVRESCRASFMTIRDKEKDLDRHFERKVREDSHLSNISKNRALYQRQKSLESYFKNSNLKEDFSIKDDQIPVGPRINLDRRSIETLFPAKSELSLKNYEDIQPASLESKLTYLENHNQAFNKPGPQTPVDKKLSSLQLKPSGALMNPLRALDAGNPTFRQLQNQFIRSASVRRDLHSSQPGEEKSVSKSPFQSSSERKSLRYSTAQKLLISSKKPIDSMAVSNGKLSPPLKMQQHLSPKTSLTSSKMMPSRYEPDHTSNPSPSSESILAKHLPHCLPAQCPPTSLQLSQSKASYLASYRREPRERERGLPNFEGSYKRTMSPSGAHIIQSSEPMKEKSASQDSGLDDKQSYSEGSKSPSQENLASSTISSCDNIETSKTLPRNYSLSLLSPTKRPTRTPRTQSDPIKATPREVIEEVAKACEPKEVECDSERLKPPQSPSAMSATSTSTEELISASESLVSVSAEEDRTVEEPLRLVQRTEVTLRVNAPTTDTACQTDVVTTPLPSPPPATSPAPSPPPIRHQLHEEIECDQLSRDLASQLSPSHRLQGILAPGPEVKRSTDYVSGLFRLDLAPRMRTSVASTTQTTVSLPPTPTPTISKEEEKEREKGKERESDRLPSDSAYFTTSECKARLLLSQNQQPPLPGNTNLHQKKEELVSRLSRKLSVLRAEAVAVEEEGRVNEALGQGVGERVSALARPHEVSKFRLHVKEVGHITSLLLGLSGRLARAENALLNLPDDHIDRKTLEGKRDKLRTQLEEAKELKRNIDRRSEAVSATLYKYLSAEEYADYDHFINMKAKLLVDSREITDKIQLGEEQLAALRETLDEPR